MFRTMHITSMNNAFDVKGKNVVVTGGNRGIGRGHNRSFRSKRGKCCYLLP